MSELLLNDSVCWVHVERTDVEFKGSSMERPKKKGNKK